MKVLFITHYIYMMGANRSMLRLMLELRDLGVTPIVLLPSHRIDRNSSSLHEAEREKTLVDYLDRYSIKYIASPFRMAKMRTTLLSTAAFLYNRMVYPSILRRVRPLGIDLIHSNSGATDLGAWLSRKLDVPHVWHLREYGDLDYNLHSPFGKFYDRRYFHGDHHFIAISRSISDHYTRLISGSPISLIYNGIEPPQSVTSREVSGDVAAVNICVVGYLSPMKCQLDAVKAVRTLTEQKIPVPFHLFLAGRGQSDYINQIQRYIDSNRLGDFVTLAGQIDDINSFLSRMDIGIMSSSSEAFGRVTVEYMMNDLAVVATDSGASREIIDNDVTGMLYPVGDVAALAGRLRVLIEDKSLRETLAGAGRRKALEQFTSQANSKAIFRLYNGLLSVG